MDLRAQAGDTIPSRGEGRFSGGGGDAPLRKGGAAIVSILLVEMGQPFERIITIFGVVLHIQLLELGTHHRYRQRNDEDPTNLSITTCMITGLLIIP